MKKFSGWGERDWENAVRNLLKRELKERGLTYQDLVDRLAAMGIEEKEINLRNKLSRGRFTAVYLVQCLVAIGSDRIRLED